MVQGVSRVFRGIQGFARGFKGFEGCIFFLRLSRGPEDKTRVLLHGHPKLIGGHKWGFPKIGAPDLVL